MRFFFSELEFSSDRFVFFFVYSGLDSSFLGRSGWGGVDEMVLLEFCVFKVFCITGWGRDCGSCLIEF